MRSAHSDPSARSARRPVAVALAISIAGWMVAASLPAPLGPPAAAAGPPTGFADNLVASVPVPTDLAFLPDGRILVTSQSGVLRVVADGALAPTPVLNLASRLCANSERGLLGVTIDPIVAANGFVYLYYTFNKHGTCPSNTSKSPVNRVARFVLAGDRIDPISERILVDNIPSPNGNHNAGDLAFGKDGLLYISVGDGGCDLDVTTNCGPANTNARDRHILSGKILRITRDGGIPADNPFLGAGSARCHLAGRTTPGLNCQETFAWGLRNPFRFAFDPDAAGTRFYINDVGQYNREEIDCGVAGADYGWNVREGPCTNGSQTNCGPPPAGMANPIYSYSHGTCNAVTGGAFVPNGLWPARYDDAYLFSDYTCDTVFMLRPDAASGLVRQVFGTGLSQAVGLAFGPFQNTQALYYTSYNGGGQVRRIRYVGAASEPPVAVATASPTAGPLPLTVAFDGSASADPDGGALTFDWNFGDGSAHATTATATHVYPAAGPFTAVLTVRDPAGLVASDTVRIDPDNSAPMPTIQTPTAATTFAVNQKFTLRGAATDAEDGQLADDALSWEVFLHHDAHTHPFLLAKVGNDIALTAPAPDDLTATTTSFLEIRLTATDVRGLSRTVSQELRPQLVDLTFATDPAGIRLRVNETTVSAPTTLTSWAGWTLQLEAPPQPDPATGETLAWTGWSDGGAAAHGVVTPASPTTYTATFAPTGAFAFTPGADAWVSATNPAANAGALTLLRVGTEPRAIAYLRFEVAGLTQAVQSATLRLAVPATTAAATANGPDVAAAVGGWSERTITWANRPALTSARFDDKGAVAAGSVVEFDVTPLVAGNGTVTVALVGGWADDLRIASRESQRPPQLVIQTGGGPLTVGAAGASASAPTAEPAPAPAPPVPSPAPTVGAEAGTGVELPFADGVESGDLATWTLVRGLVPDQDVVETGAWAARARSSGEPAFARVDLADPAVDLYARVRYNVVDRGGNGVILLRLLDADGDALVTAFVNGDGDLAYVIAGTDTPVVLGPVAPRAWHEVQIRLQIAGSRALVEVWSDGAPVGRGAARLGRVAVGSVQIGDPRDGRIFDVAFDEIALSTECGGTCPAPAPDPTATPDPAIDPPPATTTPADAPPTVEPAATEVPAASTSTPVTVPPAADAPPTDPAQSGPDPAPCADDLGQPTPCVPELEPSA